MGVELLRRRRTGLGEKKKKVDCDGPSRCSWIMSALTHSGCQCNNWHVSQDLACLKRVGGEPERRRPCSLLPPRPRPRRRLGGREYSSYGRVASYPPTRYTETLAAPQAFLACMYCVSRRIRTTTAMCTRVVWGQCLARTTYVRVTTKVDISRMFFPSRFA